MAQPNRISVVLDDATLAEVRKAVGVLRTKLVPALKTLSSQDRQELPKLGDKTTAFVQKAYEYMGVHPDLVPPFVDREEFRVDLEALELLRGLERELAPVNDAISDTATLSGSEAYQAALLFYGSLKSAQKMNVGSSAQVFSDLSARFPHTKAHQTAKA